MAEEQPRRKRRAPREEGTSDGTRRRPPPAERLTGAQLAQRARRDLAEITGRRAESVTSLERQENGSWKVTVELLELSRVPETDDVLGSYEVEVGGDGELLGYRRVRRYARSQAHDDQRVRG